MELSWPGLDRLGRQLDIGGNLNQFCPDCPARIVLGKSSNDRYSALNILFSCASHWHGIYEKSVCLYQWSAKNEIQVDEARLGCQILSSDFRWLRKRSPEPGFWFGVITSCWLTHIATVVPCPTRTAMSAYLRVGPKPRVIIIIGTQGITWQICPCCTEHSWERSGRTLPR